MGREQRGIAQDPPMVGLEVWWAGYIRLARTLVSFIEEGGTFATTEAHAFVPRRHIGAGRFEVDDSPAPELYEKSILRARIAHMSRALCAQLGLGEPYPQALGKPHSRFGFYVWTARGSFCFQNFAQEYSAKFFIESLIQGSKFRWLDKRTLLTESGIKIRGEGANDLETIIEHEMTDAERQWEPPEPVATFYRTFPTGESVSLPPRNEMEAAPRKKGERRAKKASAAHEKAAPRGDGLVSLAEICEELKIEPRIARALLRASNTPKPDHGWAWAKGDVPAIEKTLTGE